MTKKEAKQYMAEHNDDDLLNDDDLESVFFALFGRQADDIDRVEGIWSHCCSALE